MDLSWANDVYKTWLLIQGDYSRMDSVMIEIRPYMQTDLDRVIELWAVVFPNAPAHNDPLTDIQSKLSVQPELFFLAESDERIIGTAMSGFDGHRGWVYYVAVHPEYRRRGIGTRLMEKVELALINTGCPKLNLQIRADNAAVQAFYESLGYLIEDRISMGKRLSEADGSE
jgi:ribosomal protein S18 acetylase RimI-like enzyme